MTKEELKKSKKKESNRRYQERLKADLRPNKTNLRLLKTDLRSLKTDLRQDLTWNKIEDCLKTPQAVFLLVISLIFTSFLVWQSSVFFQNSGMSLVKSLIFSLVGEGVFLCSAAMMFVGKTRTQKFFSSLIFVCSLVSLVVFLHHGASTHSNLNSPEYLTQKGILSDLRQDLSSLRKSRDQLPQGYVSKSLDIQNKIDKKSKEELKTILSLDKIKKGGLKTGQMYLSWLRIAVLLLNILLVHKIIQIFSFFTVKSS